MVRVRRKKSIPLKDGRLAGIARLIRHHILMSTTRAGSGHPTSSMSATDLMTALMFGGIFRFDLDRPEHPNNDRLIFSKGHASPLFYALFSVAGKLTPSELLTLRKLNSPLEGHPAMAFPYTEAATGSLGQGLSIGVGMALNAKYLDRVGYRTYVLLGDSEMAEGSQWEAIQIAAHYKLDNLVGILDVNRLGQRGQTMYGHDIQAYIRRVSAFGWHTLSVDGHSLPKILAAYRQAIAVRGKPVMIVAKTLKGAGTRYLADKDNWHGKPVTPQELDRVLKELGPVDQSLTAAPAKPLPYKIPPGARKPAVERAAPLAFDKPTPTRKAYGQALVTAFKKYPNIVVLDAETSNSTYAEIFAQAHPDRFFEMYIAEQNMAGVALGLSRRGKIPFVSTFAAFLTRAYDQIRMSQYSRANIKFVGSHAGVSIGEDGPSQMGLEEIAMFRAILGSVVLYPADAWSAARLVEEAARHVGMVYLRTTRKETPLLYGPQDEFPIGGCKVLRQSDRDAATVVAAGITLHEALAAAEELRRDGTPIRVIDLYSIKPIDAQTLRKAAADTGHIVTVEDHFAEGGLGEAVLSALADTPVRVTKLAVRKLPKSGKPEELLDYEDISKRAIMQAVRQREKATTPSLRS
ncbi:MAG: transketolase [Candidatus Lindowbacteria bacterium RIFCSPLOWO2_12_FULL_62_27]|nr:MAG: transketolase [Candidatus Lindowbacteria bacterium RIFCSPLOWO2_02_FULL_62_12]OGH59000.1 MAG: transketolase [Candidatus Lindowbacteria bacterium RIFCSPLOWO2_12_FULL_62_27]